MIGQQELQYFMEVARSKHFTRAAERLGLTQPALSHAVARLERSVGHSLFERSKKGASLTAAGQRLFEEGEKLLAHWEALLRSVHEDVSSVGGLVRFGCNSAVAHYTLAKFLPKLLKDHPRLELQLRHGLSRHMTEEVVRGKLEVAIAVNPIAHPDLVIIELCRDLFSVWQAKKCLNPGLLMYEPNLMQSQEILAKLKKAGIHFAQHLEGPSLEVLAELMAAGAGAAILPTRVAETFSKGSAKRILKAPEFPDRVCLIFQPSFRKTETGRVLIEAIKQAFS
jgi:DNA-binding transcriptional LysR family regulator